jgi:hypothetical protein
VPPLELHHHHLAEEAVQEWLGIDDCGAHG